MNLSFNAENQYRKFGKRHACKERGHRTLVTECRDAGA